MLFRSLLFYREFETARPVKKPAPAPVSWLARLGRALREAFDLA